MANLPRFGLIGTGVWAQSVAMPAAAASSEVRFAALLGRNGKVVDALATQYRAQAFTGYDSFLDAVDIVGIAVPPAVQPSFARAAIARGKPVLLEKPVALNVGEAERMAEDLERAGLRSAVFFTHLYMSAVADWLQQVTSAGGWMGARIESFSQVLIDPASPYYGTAAWRGPAGALWDIGPHAVALLLWVLGPVERVFANKGRGDHTQTLLVHRSGALSSISLAMDAPAPIPGETAFYGKHGRWAMPPIGDWVGGSRQAYGSAIAPLVSPGEPHPADARFGLAVTRVLWGAEQSQRRGLAIII